MKTLILLFFSHPLFILLFLFLILYFSRIYLAYLLEVNMSLNYRALALMLSALAAPLALTSTEPEILIGTETMPPIPAAEKALSPAASNEINKIDAELNNLTTELTAYRKKALNVEMQAQPLMIDNWHSYAEDVRLSEEDQKHVAAIKDRMNVLIERKKALLKNSQAN